MEFMKQAQQLAAELTKEFNGEEIVFNAQVRRGDDWITLELYRNSEDPHRIHAILDFDTGCNILLQTPKTVH